MNSIDFSHINQDKVSKSFHFPVQSPNLLQFDSLLFTAESFIKYIQTLRGVGKDVFDFIWKFRNIHPSLKNKTIADAIGCHPKTVQGWTTRFMKEGILIKAQVNRFAPNYFYLHPRIKSGDISWALTQNRLTTEQKDLYIQTGTIIPVHKIKSSQTETTPHYKYSLPVFKSISSSPSIIFIRPSDFSPTVYRKKPKPTSAAPGFDMERFKKQREEYKRHKEKSFWDDLDAAFDAKPNPMPFKSSKPLQVMELSEIEALFPDPIKPVYDFSNFDEIFPDIPSPSMNKKAYTDFSHLSDIEALFN